MDIECGKWIFFNQKIEKKLNFFVTIFIDDKN